MGRRRDTRGAIIAAATTAIAERGVRNLRVEDVARAADVSPALLYYHFGDRAGLVRAALDRANEQAPSMRGGADATPDGDARAWLVSALLAELDETPAVRDSSIVWNEVSASAIFDPALREALQRVTDTWTARVRDAVAAGVRDGSIAAHVDPATAAEQLTATVEGLSLRWLAGTVPLDRARELLAGALDAHAPAPLAAPAS